MAHVAARGQGERSAASKPRGREEVIAALLASARTLIAERGPGVALRDIADHAGVNFGLLYHYLGTKDQVVDVVVGAAAEQAAGQLAGAADADDAIARLMAMGDGTAARLIGWAVLDGRGGAPAFRDSPALAVLADLVRGEAAGVGATPTAGSGPSGGSADEAQVFAAFAMTVTLAWRLFGETALVAAGVDPAQPASHTETITGYLQQLASAVAGGGQIAHAGRSTEPGATEATPRGDRPDRVRRAAEPHSTGETPAAGRSAGADAPSPGRRLGEATRRGNAPRPAGAGMKGGVS